MRTQMWYNVVLEMKLLDSCCLICWSNLNSAKSHLVGMLLIDILYSS